MDSILPFLVPQPRPLVTQVGYLDVAGKTVTAITRRFAEADVRRCTLCPSCSAFEGVCTVLVGCLVPIEEAKTFDAHATDFQPLDRPDADGRRNVPWLNN